MEQIDRTLADLGRLRRAFLSARRTAVETQQAGGDTVAFKVTEAVSKPEG
ncbi:hypothetical protein OG304_04895 [Streptomyces sp. NBC_00160]|nr:hypothetical protein [Streptomyces sp. NBC_00160]MCX5302787.1 hypothetical protein [Streptomyces sp. NBC_00160]